LELKSDVMMMTTTSVVHVRRMCMIGMSMDLGTFEGRVLWCCGGVRVAVVRNMVFGD
jgi:hypothetical protein